MWNKKINYIIYSVILILVVYSVSIFVFNKNPDTLKNNPVYDTLTSKPKLEDDFYNYINYDYLKTNQIKDGENTWSVVFDNEKKIANEKKKVIDSILNSCDSYQAGTINYNICLLFKSYKNNDLNNAGKTVMDSYINRINNVNNIEEYIKLINNLNSELSIDILYNPSIGSVPNELKKMYFSLDPISYEFSVTESEYYKKSDYEQQLNNLKKYNVKLLELYGYSENESNKMSNAIQEMYKEFARYAINSDKLNDKGFKLYDKISLQNELNNINIDNILYYYSHLYKNGQQILVVDINQLKSVDKYLVIDNLETLKYYAIVKILTNYSEYIDFSFYKLNNEFNEIINGIENNIKDEDYVYELIYSAFKDTVLSQIIDNNFSLKEKEFYESLIEEEINAYKLRIMNEKWLSDETKIQAVKKMDNISYSIAKPNNMVFVESNYKLNDNLILNAININKNITMETYKQYHIGNLLYGADYLDINAYYEPSTNSITILYGWIYSMNQTFNYNLDNLSNDYIKVLSTTGFVIGHELSHALDSTGSKYDFEGNYVNWWLEEDFKKFNILNAKVVKYYNKYNQFGSQTLGENIADLGSMAILMQIAESKNANDDDYKLIFENYAKLWCSQSTPYYRSMALNFDEHSPNKNRVNAVLSSISEFYRVYNISKNDKMYVSEEDRVEVW